MSITYIGGSTGNTTATAPAHVKDDVFVAYSFGNALQQPSLPSGWEFISGGAGSTYKYVVGYKIAANSTTPVGTFFNSKALAVAVYRPTDGDRFLRVFNQTSIDASSNVINYGALTRKNLGEESTYVAAAGHLIANNDLGIAPTGFVNRIDAVVNGLRPIAVHDINGLNSANLAATSVDVGGGTGPYGTIVMELTSVPKNGWDMMASKYTGLFPDVSNAGKTVTVGAQKPVVVASATVNTSGKKYVEVKAEAVSNANAFAVTVVDKVFQPNESLRYFANGALLSKTGALITTFDSYTTGDVVSIALDLDGNKAWFSKNGGLWNLSATDDPATGSGGLTYAASNSYIGGNLTVTSESASITANGTFAYTVPSGYASWY